MVRRPAGLRVVPLARRDLQHPARRHAPAREPALRQPGLRARQAPRHAVPRRDDRGPDPQLAADRRGRGARVVRQPRRAAGGADRERHEGAPRPPARGGQPPLRALDAEPQSRKLMNCSGRSVTCARTSWIALCRSSFLPPDTRTASPWIEPATFSLLSLISLTML